MNHSLGRGFLQRYASLHDLPRGALLQQKLGGLNHRMAMEPPPHDPVQQTTLASASKDIP